MKGTEPLQDSKPGTGAADCGLGVVLLSTWNGQAHLSEQLESLAGQTGAFRMKLLIRDDGSRDGTIERVHAFCGQYGPHHAEEGGSKGTGFFAQVSCGENIGFVGSFLALLRMADPEADWYAFCDQDDVWQPDKLDRAVSLLRMAEANASGEGIGRGAKDGCGRDAKDGCGWDAKDGCGWDVKDGCERDVKERKGATGIPLLYASRLELVDASLAPMGYTRPLNKKPSFENALVENIATGATMVMNRAARNVICEGLEQLSRPGGPSAKESPQTPGMNEILLHDWWCYLVIAAFGKVVFDSESRILHRQHGGNTVGHKAGFLARQKRRLERYRSKRDVTGITRQAFLFEKLYGCALQEREAALLRRFLAKDANIWRRICYAIKPDVVRQAWYDGVLMRLLILAGKL